MSKEGDLYKVKYNLIGGGHKHIVTISTDKAHFTTKTYGQYRIDITITDLARMENVDFFFIATGRFATRKMCETRPKHFDFLKRWILIQEEIADYAPYHKYKAEAIVSCIESFFQHIDNEVEKDYAQKAADASRR